MVFICVITARSSALNYSNIRCPACAECRSVEQIAFPHYTAYLCAECRLSFGVPDVPVGDADFNNYTWTMEWTKNFPQHVSKAQYSLAEKRKTIKRLAGVTVSSMLDIGCGNGAFLAAAEKLGIQAEGTDIDLEHTKFANQMGLKATHCDILDYQTAGQFDLIHVKESFHLVTNPKEFIGRIVAMMGPRTILYLDSTHADGLAARYRKRFVTPPRYGQLYPPLHNRSYNQTSLTYILEKAGLKIVKFISFNRGNPVYCPTRGRSLKQYIVNPVLDWFFLGGFVGCYATVAQA
jgi:SAM-dependent methyltransferase